MHLAENQYLVSSIKFYSTVLNYRKSNHLQRPIHLSILSQGLTLAMCVQCTKHTTQKLYPVHVYLHQKEPSIHMSRTQRNFINVYANTWKTRLTAAVCKNKTLCAYENWPNEKILHMYMYGTQQNYYTKPLYKINKYR